MPNGSSNMPWTRSAWKSRLGLPPLQGAIWRIGLLGYNANAANVALVVQAFRDALAEQGFCRGTV